MWSEYTYEDLMGIPPTKMPCFLAGTLVKTDKGLQSIEEITAGQQVYARNMVNEQIELKTVTQTFVNYAEMYIRIGTKGDIIQATGQHRFWLSEEKRWCMANSLQVGMVLLSNNGQNISIQSLEVITERVDTYNLEVEDHHNYYVGKDEILAHNQTSRPSIFANPGIIENVRFYRHFIGRTDLYIGQTLQGIGPRYEQHMNDYESSRGTKKVWMVQEPGVDNIRINGITPPYSMTRYEIAVTEMHEIYKAGGRRGIDPEGKLYNRHKVISKKKFDMFKDSPSDPCRFYEDL